MTGDPGPEGTPRPSTGERAQGEDLFGLEGRERDAALAWVGEHLTEMRQWASGQRVFYWILGLAFVLGLAAHVGGFLLKEDTTTEFVLLVADLLYALGFALWTSVVVVIFVEIWPEAKKRQYRRALEAYEAAVSRQVQAGRGHSSEQTSQDPRNRA